MTDDENKKKIESLEKAMNMFGGPKAKETKAKSEAPKKQEVQIHETQPIEPEIKDKFVEKFIPEAEQEDEEIEDIPVKKENKSPSKSFPLEKLKENLKPEIKEAFKKAVDDIPKETVTKLMEYMESGKNQVFDSKVTDVFDNLSPAEASLLSKKMAEWDIPQEASEINASVIVAWLNKTKK